MLFIVALAVVNLKRAGIPPKAVRVTVKAPLSSFPVLFGERQGKNKTRSLQLSVSPLPSLSHSFYELRPCYSPGTVYSSETRQTQSLLS